MACKLYAVCHTAHTQHTQTYSGAALLKVGLLHSECFLDIGFGLQPVLFYMAIYRHI